MNAKPLTAVLSIATAVVWGGYALVSPKYALFPLLGFLPMPVWPEMAQGYSPWWLLPIAVYVSLPVLAWIRDSRVVATCIPISPLVGIGSCLAQFAFGMSSFR